jgi:hypothetical protein
MEEIEKVVFSLLICANDQNSKAEEKKSVKQKLEK